MNRSEPGPISTEYHERVASVFGGDVKAAFLQELRNELAHAQLPIVSSTESISAGSTTVAIVLPCDALLKWKMEQRHQDLVGPAPERRG